MSKLLRRPHLKAPFDTKHVIVAACAAIAMLLGSLSVGASTSSTPDRPITSAEVSSLMDTRDSTSSSSSVGEGTLSHQHTIEVRSFLQQQTSPLYVPPTATKTLRNSVSPILGTANPVLFMTQMVQLQQQQAQPAPTAAPNKGGDTSKDTGYNTPPTEPSSGTSGGSMPSGGTTSPTESSSISGSSSSSPPSSGGSSTLGIMSKDTSETPAQ
jgi:hypothetical protein